MAKKGWKVIQPRPKLLCDCADSRNHGPIHCGPLPPEFFSRLPAQTQGFVTPGTFLYENTNLGLSLLSSVPPSQPILMSSDCASRAAPSSLASKINHGVSNIGTLCLMKSKRFGSLLIPTYTLQMATDCI